MVPGFTDTNLNGNFKDKINFILPEPAQQSSPAHMYFTLHYLLYVI